MIPRFQIYVWILETQTKKKKTGSARLREGEVFSLFVGMLSMKPLQDIKEDACWAVLNMVLKLPMCKQRAHKAQ